MEMMIKTGDSKQLFLFCICNAPFLMADKTFYEWLIFTRCLLKINIFRRWWLACYTGFCCYIKIKIHFYVVCTLQCHEQFICGINKVKVYKKGSEFYYLVYCKILQERNICSKNESTEDSLLLFLLLC